MKIFRPKYLLALIALILASGCCPRCAAQVVRLWVVAADGTEGQATAACIGETADRAAVFLTAKHNFRGARNAKIFLDGQWHSVRQVNQHRTADVASFEVAGVRCPAYQLAVAPGIDEEVLIPGYGPEYNGRKASTFAGILKPDVVRNDSGYHIIPGDSGAPILQQYCIVGVATGYEGDPIRTPDGTLYRNSDAGARRGTVYTRLTEIQECLQQCYQSCPPGGCKIWIRNEYRQPIGFLGLPAGPPQRVRVAEPVPQTYVPEQAAMPRPLPDPISTQGPPGPPGPQGPAGRSVSREEVELIVNTWLDSNRDALIGPPGPTGPAGPAGSTANIDALESRLSSLERRPFRIILSNDGQIVDDETYEAGEPVVLDLKRLRSGSGDK